MSGAILLGGGRSRARCGIPPRRVLAWTRGPRELGAAQPPLPVPVTTLAVAAGIGWGFGRIILLPPVTAVVRDAVTLGEAGRGRLARAGGGAGGWRAAAALRRRGFRGRPGLDGC